MASATAKKNIIITLDSLEVPSLKRRKLQKHMLNLTLVWPRLNVASKTSSLTVPVANGLCSTTAWSWTNKICFKEAVEGDFGFRVALTESINAETLKKFIRFIAGKGAGIASDAIEDAISIPVADELAALPMLYLSKQLLASQDPDLIVEGCLDLKSSMFSDTPVQISVPLISRRNNEKSVSKLDRDGSAVFTVTTC